MDQDLAWKPRVSLSSSSPLRTPILELQWFKIYQVAKDVNRCVCYLMAAMLVPLGWAPTWRPLTKLYKQYLCRTFWGVIHQKKTLAMKLGQILYSSILTPLASGIQ